MKKIIVLLCLLGAFCIPRETHAQRVYSKIDSMVSLTRPTFTFDVSGFLYNTIIFENLVTGDSVKLYSLSDSLHPKHKRDTIPLYTRNLATYAEYSNGLITGLTSPSLALQILNPYVRKIFMRKGVTSGTTANGTVKIYFRVEGITP